MLQLAHLLMLPMLGAALSINDISSSMVSASSLRGRQAQQRQVPESDTSQDAEVDPSEAYGQAGPCSCDCCQGVKLMSYDFVPQKTGGQVTSICAKAWSGPEGNQNPTCPNQCNVDRSNKILPSSKGPMDYSRYCHYNCQPVSDAVGSSCVQYDIHWTKKTIDGDGNGQESNAPPVLGIGSPYVKEVEMKELPGQAAEAVVVEKEAVSAAESSSPAAAAKMAAELKKIPKLQIVYDMRKLVAERLRSEAGAMVSTGAASAEQVRLNVYRTKEARDQLEKVSALASKSANKLEGSVAVVEADTESAEAAEIKTRKLLKESRSFAGSFLKEVKDLTEAAIKKAVTPCVETVAGLRAQGMHLDKPDDWVKVVAARAANPYQQAVTASVQRADEYRRMAEGLHGKAMAAQKEANALIPHVNAMKAHGDTVQEAIDRQHVTTLLANARSLQQEAQGVWNTADAAVRNIPKWQEAAQQAAAYAAWDYKASEEAFKSNGK